MRTLAAQNRAEGGRRAADAEGPPRQRIGVRPCVPGPGLGRVGPAGHSIPQHVQLLPQLQQLLPSFPELCLQLLDVAAVLLVFIAAVATAASGATRRG